MIEKPLTNDQIDRMLYRNGVIRVEIAIPLEVLIENDRESLNEYVGDRIIEGVLRNVTYRLTGHTFGGYDDKCDPLPQLAIVEVTGTPA
jgi:hypothetical protein